MMKHPQLQNFVGGSFVPSHGKLLDVLSPIDESLLSRIPLSSVDELNTTVSAAQAAFPAWSGLTVRERAQIACRYRLLLEQNFDDLAALVREENGKTLDEARAEVAKAIEFTEFACSLPQLAPGGADVEKC